MDIMIYYSLLRYCTVLKLATPLPCDQYGYSLLRYCTVLKQKLKNFNNNKGYSLLRYCTVLKPKDPKIIFI